MKVQVLDDNGNFVWGHAEGDEWVGMAVEEIEDGIPFRVVAALAGALAVASAFTKFETSARKEPVGGNGKGAGYSAGTK